MMKGKITRALKGLFSKKPPGKNDCGNSYVQEVTKQIKNKSAASLTEQELYAHILDKADYYEELGYTREQAFEKATEDMGDPKLTAAALNTLHSKEWYKQLSNWLAFLLLLWELVLYIFLQTKLENKFAYSGEGDITHRISVDFLSLACLASAFLLIRYAGRRNSKFICLCAAVFAGFQLYGNMFEPAFFAVAKIFTSGFAGYRDSVYAYGLIPGEIKGFLTGCAFASAWVLLIYCALELYGIYSRERGAVRGRPFLPVKVISIIIACVLALNTAVTVGCTAAAYIGLDEKISENQSLREAEIEFVLNADLSGETADITKKFYAAGFSPLKKQEQEYDFFEQYIYSKDNTQLMLSADKTEQVSVNYGVMTSYMKCCLLNKNLSIDESVADEFAQAMTLVQYTPPDYDEYSTTIYRSDEGAITLDEFLDRGFYNKACAVTKNYSLEDKSTNVHFMLKLENSQYETVDFSFEDGRLTYLTFWYDLE